MTIASLPGSVTPEAVATTPVSEGRLRPVVVSVKVLHLGSQGLALQVEGAPKLIGRSSEVIDLMVTAPLMMHSPQTWPSQVDTPSPHTTWSPTRLYTLLHAISSPTPVQAQPGLSWSMHRHSEVTAG